MRATLDTNPMTTNHRLRIFWIIPPILIGILALAFLKDNKTAPVKVEAEPPARLVRTVLAQRVDLRPMAEGYGVVQPARVWTAVAQVSGRVVEMHPRLRNGEILLAGALLFRLDPVDYELALAQLQAESAELKVQEQNTQDLLAIEQRNLTLAQREAQRLKDLANQGTSSRSQADEAERSVLASRASVQTLKNTLALLPSQRAVLAAKLAQAKRDLDNTQVKAPFNLRIASLDMEIDQYITKGQKLFAGDDVDRAEVIAQIPISPLRHLFLGHTAPNLTSLSSSLAEYADIQSVIEMDMGGHVAEWQAEFVRFTDNIDDKTRTMGAVVALDKPFDKIIPGRRPPLSKGMFVKVRLLGRIQPDQLVVPRNAIRDGKIMLINPASRLSIRPIEVLYHQNDLSVIASGLEPGQPVVASDLVPAITGMRLRGQHDEKLQQQLMHSAGMTP